MPDRISIDPTVCHGKPVIRGTRVLVSTLLGAIAGGDSIETVLEDYPNVTREDIAAALEFVSQPCDVSVDQLRESGKWLFDESFPERLRH